MFTQVIIRKQKKRTDLCKTDGLTDDQRETIIPCHYCVAGYKNTKEVYENKETESPSGIYRMKLPGKLLKESHENNPKKTGLLFLGSGTPTFWLGLLHFILGESGTPTCKILVRTLDIYYKICFLIMDIEEK